jgi:hypothetical protein
MTAGNGLAAWQPAARLMGLVGVTGLVAGALAGWVGLARADGSAAVAAAAAPWFWTLAVLAPGGLALGVAAEEPGSLRPGVATALRTGAIGFTGALLAALLFLVTASQVPAVFTGEQAAELIAQLGARIFWRDALLLSALTALAGAVLGVLKQRSR